MSKKSLYNLIKELSKDKFYGNAGYVKELIEDELKNMKRIAYFTKGLRNYSVGKKRKKIVFFENDVDYILLRKELQSRHPEGIPKKNEKKKLKQFYSTQTKKLKQFYSAQAKKVELTFSAHVKVNHTENLIHLWLYQGLEKFGNDGNKIDIVGYDYLEHGNDPSLFIEVNNLKKFLIDKKYPLPAVFFEEDYPNSEKFLNSLKDGDLAKPFSIKALKEFMVNEASSYFKKQKNQYAFYLDGAQWYVAFEDQSVYVEKKDRKGMIIIHYLLTQYMLYKKVPADERGDYRANASDLYYHLLKNKLYYEQIKPENFSECVKQSIIFKLSNGSMHFEGPLSPYSQDDIDILNKSESNLHELIQSASKNNKSTKKLKKELDDIRLHKKSITKKSGDAKVKTSENVDRIRISKNIEDVLKYLKKQKSENEKEGIEIYKIIKHIHDSIKRDDGFYYEPPGESSIEWQLKTDSE